MKKLEHKLNNKNLNLTTMFKEPKNDEDVIDFLRGMVQKPNEPKEDQWLRDNYPGLFPPKK